MLKKKIWIPILIVLLVVIGCGLFYARQVSKQAPVKVYKVVEVEEPETPKPPPPGETAESGHWHGDEWHAEPHETQTPPSSKHGLTYHAKLLETHPVEALRLQAQERGHWSAKWIPPFPPEDTEAAAIARDYYLITYYESIGDTTNPICLKALKDSEARFRADHEAERDLWDRGAAFTLKDRIPPSEEYKRYKWETARRNDLGKLRWPRVSDKYVEALRPERRSSHFPKPQ